MDDLKDVAHTWLLLGSFLGVRTSKLQAIDKDYKRHGPERCLIEILIVWKQQKPPNWSDVLRALMKMEMNTLAQKIAEKHGMNMLGCYT